VSANDRFRDTLAALRAARESRDGYPSEFASELITVVGSICDGLSVTDQQRRDALQVAELHDIGMLGVPVEVLVADRSLTASERLEVEQAPATAARLLDRIPGLEGAADAVRHVREHWDGSGYPDGLEGEKIPLVSRIVAVASAYVAMTSPRHHRAAMHPRNACNQLNDGAGTQFDRHAVDVLLDLIEPLISDD